MKHIPFLENNVLWSDISLLIVEVEVMSDVNKRLSGCSIHYPQHPRSFKDSSAVKLAVINSPQREVDPNIS